LFSVVKSKENIMPDTVTSLRKENDALKIQINGLKDEFKKLEALMREQGESLKRSKPDNDEQVKECVRSSEFLSSKYDTINADQSIIKQELQRLSSKITEVAMKVDNIGSAIDDLQQYSYQYNIKLVGVPQQNAKESAYETSKLCVDLFYAIGADISIHDIDTAHRVPSRKQDGKPNPIICKETCEGRRDESTA
jgi:chromosome segregation ATPase